MALEMRGAIGGLTENWSRFGARHWFRDRYSARLRYAWHYWVEGAV